MSKLPSFVIQADDGVLEYYLDHTILSSARMCEARFVLDHVENLRPKGIAPWPLNFGSLIHSCMEYLYKHFMAQDFSLENWLKYCSNLWREGHFEQYDQFPQSKALGGFQGFIAMLGQYFGYYKSHVFVLKPVALEIPFGRGKEVPLLEDSNLYKWAPFRLYLTGRMDYIFDDGRHLGPLDHKTFSTEGKNPAISYEVQEGMTGYVYAMTHVYQRIKAQMELEYPGLSYERQTNIVWMNFILTKSQPDMNKRFLRIPIYKTPEQLEDWRIRQISTVAKIHQILFDGRPPDWNTSVCTNYWHSTCHYQSIHRLPTKNDQLFVLTNPNHFAEIEPWNPESED